MADGTVIFNLIGKDLASKAFESVAKSADKLGKSVSKNNPGLELATKGISRMTGAAAVATAGLVALGAGFVKVSDEATNLSLGVGKARLLFGQDFAAMDQWASTLSKRIGVTRVEGLRLAGGFANLARQSGWTQRQTVGLSQQYVELIQKVSMLSDGQFDQAGAAEALASAFRGEYDALQRVVPTISDAAIKQNALNIKKREGKKISDDQARQLAVLDIVQRGTVAGAALMETAEGKKAIAIANTRAQIREQGQDIELALLPAISSLWQQVEGQAVPAMQHFAQWVGSPDGQDQIMGYAQNVFTIASAMGVLVQQAGSAVSALQGFANGLQSLTSFDLSKLPIPSGLGVLAWAGGRNKGGAVHGDHSDDAREGRRVGGGSAAGSSGLKIPVLPSGMKLGGGGAKSDIVNMMIRIGQAGAQGLAFGIRGKASVIQEAIQSVMDKAKDAYQKQLDKLNELKGKRSDLASSISDGIKSAGGSAITGAGGGGLLGRLAQASRNAGSFYGALKRLKAMRLNPGLLQQIAEAGPVDGLRAAREIIAAGSASGFNKQAAMLDRYGAAAGAFVGDSVYGAAIKKQQGAVDRAKAGLFGATIVDNRIVNITIPKGYVGSAKDLAAMIKDALKQSGNAGQRVSLK